MENFNGDPGKSAILKQILELGDPDFDTLFENSRRYSANLRKISEQKEDLSDVPNPSRRRFIKRGAAVTGVALGAGVLSQIGRATDTLGLTNERLTVLDELIKPLIEEAKKRRKARAESDPNFYHRVDKELNEDRINILLFLKGTFLRHGLESTIHGANQIISFNTKRKTIDLISITSDVRGPKAERYAENKGHPSKRLSINSAYDTVKQSNGDETEAFRLMGESFEEATGLSMDFQGVSTSGIVKDFIDKMFGSIEVDVPYDFFAYKVDIDGVEHPDHTFKQGKQSMDGVKVVQYISADDYERIWKDRLHHHRKHLIFGAIREAVKRNLSNPVSKVKFGANFMAFLKPQLDQGKLKLDFDIGPLLNFGALADPKLIGRALGFDEIKDDQSILIVDPVYGGEGVRMVAADAEHNPKTREDLDRGRYPDLEWMQVPDNSNPDADDLVTDYWGKLGGPRDIIKRKLSQAA